MLTNQNVMAGSVIGILGLALTYVLFGSFFHYLLITWNIDPFYLHGPWIGILAIALYGKFLWSKRHTAILPLEKEDQSLSFVFLILTLVVFVMGAKTGIPFLGGISFLCWALTFQFLFFQRTDWKEFTFPFFFFLVSVPLPYLNELSGHLQLWIARLIKLKFSVLGYSLIQEGITLKLPQATFQIAADCTGIKSWLVLWSLVLFFLYFLSFRFKTKIAIMISVLPIAFVSNFIRVMILIFLGYHKGEAFAMNYWHSFGGVIFYALSCVCVLGVFGLAKRYESSY